MGIVLVGLILGGNFLRWKFSGWELFGGNHLGGNFTGGSFHVTQIRASRSEIWLFYIYCFMTYSRVLNMPEYT